MQEAMASAEAAPFRVTMARPTIASLARVSSLPKSEETQNPDSWLPSGR